MPPLNQQEKAWVQEWLNLANHDLRAAGQMFQDDAALYGYLIAFICQQATEKFAKAALTVEGVNFPKTHDITRLLVLFPPIFVFTQQEFDDAARISDYAVEVRYPGLTIVMSDLQEALRIARHFRTRLLPGIQAALV
ncbi:HEPN domain-containing protein [Hymenobacter fastidiosus]|uniref:HEPN domain-containing protein n=1 Tax=Hymenobacter fastidiosus TaxID=486264 RepID=A0ABP7RK87_9BACT